MIIRYVTHWDCTWDKFTKDFFSFIEAWPKVFFSKIKDLITFWGDFYTDFNDENDEIAIRMKIS